MATSLTVQLNGAERTFEDLGDEPTVASLIAHLGLRPDRVALEQNGEIAFRSTWEQTPVHNGDHIELVHFVGGGLSLKCLHTKEIETPFKRPT